jgi:hypothetical protein
MELDDLKSAWNRISTENEKHSLRSADELRKMLQVRTTDITEKIRRNIRIGIGIILGWVSIGFAIDFFLTPIMEKQLDKPYLTDELMFWSFLIEALNYLLIFSAIIIFWIRYNKMERENSDTSNLRSKLKGLIGILDSYRRMFYIVMGIVLIYVMVSFSSGFFMEYNYQIEHTGFDLKALNIWSWLVIVGAFLLSLGLFIIVYLLLFTLFFKRLYGRYLKQLKLTLQELDENPQQSS